jgi:hypothetical protein
MDIKDFYNPIDFSKIIDCPCEFPEAIVENLPDFHNNDDAYSHIKAFGWCINEGCDPHTHEGVLMKLFSLTLVEGDAYDWFHDSDDNEFKTIQDLMHAFLERFGDDQVETYNELVDTIMEKWKGKEPLDVKTISLDIKMDAPIEKLTGVEATQFIYVNQCN